MIIAIIIITYCYCGTGSSVGIATGYGLEGPGIETHSRFSSVLHSIVQNSVVYSSPISKCNTIYQTLGHC
jgi:hypothetical protein